MMKTKRAPMDLIVRTVYRHNILPITSACNAGCVFCSHRGNPDDVEVFTLPKLDLKDYGELISFLDPKRKIILGESATRIIEGEPFTNPKIFDILSMVRENCPDVLIQITTNGSLLDKACVNKLEQFKPLELNVSVNSLNYRKTLMGLRKDHCFEGLKLLKQFEIPFNTSVVPINISDTHRDFIETIKFLEKTGSQLIRVFVPGWSKLVNPRADFFKLHQIILDQLHKALPDVTVPVVVEPPVIRDLIPEVEGVIKGSPAAKCGLKRGDIIKKVNGNIVTTRVEAYNTLKTMGSCDLQLLREKEIIQEFITKQPGEYPGAVFLYDINPVIVGQVERMLREYTPRKPAAVTSLLGEPIIKKALNHLSLDIITVPNRFFGGSICCSGLLTVDDIKKQLKEEKVNADLIILPQSPFDELGRDLTGTSYRELQDVLGCEVVVIKS